MKQYLSLLQIVVSAFLIITILLQKRGSALGSAFGGGYSYFSRRGIEKILFWSSCILALLFVILALLSLIL